MGGVGPTEPHSSHLFIQTCISRHIHAIRNHFNLIAWETIDAAERLGAEAAASVNGVGEPAEHYAIHRSPQRRNSVWEMPAVLGENQFRPFVGQRFGERGIKEGRILMGVHDFDSSAIEQIAQAADQPPIAAGFAVERNDLDAFASQLFAEGTDEIEADDGGFDARAEPADRLGDQHFRARHLHGVQHEPHANRPHRRPRFRSDQEARRECGRQEDRNNKPAIFSCVPALLIHSFMRSYLDPGIVIPHPAAESASSGASFARLNLSQWAAMPDLAGEDRSEVLIMQTIRSMFKPTLFCVALTAMLPVVAMAEDHSVAASSAAHSRRKIVVTGHGKMNVKPDIAYVALGVTSEKQTAAEAMEANNAAMSQLFELLGKLGIEENDVQTTGFSISPQYHYPKNQPRQLTGYVATNQIRVKVRKLQDTGRVVDRLVKQGANQVNSISFGVSDRDAHLDAARREAVANARHKAELYAQAANVPLGSLINLTESSGSRPPVQPFFAGAMKKEQAVPIAPGEQELTVTVTAEYAIGEK